MPEITGLSVSAFPRSGGSQIVVYGSGFQGTSRVYFRDQNLKEYEAQSYTVDNDGQITVVSPRVGDLGTFHIYVVSNGQKSTTPGVTVTVPDGDSMAATGTFGVNNTTVAGDHNRVQSQYPAGSLDEFGKRDLLSQLKKYGSDPNWVAMQLRLLNEEDAAWFKAKVPKAGQPA